MDGQSFGRALGDAMFALAVAAFAAGVAACGIGWALWHFVLSHIVLGWRP